VTGVPLGGDWASGERVFGPPTGTFDADWLVPVVREALPDVDHDEARAAVGLVWAVVREEAVINGVAASEVDEDTVRRRVGLPAAGDPPSRSGAPQEPDALLTAALVAVRAAVRAYHAS
jgi:hypothetical protein